MRAVIGSCLLFGVLLVTVGCNQSYPVAPVSGRVTCKGVPVKEASIVFSPMGKQPGDPKAGKAAGGQLDADGKFTLSTFSPGDGAIIGKHRVSLSLDNPYNSKLPCALKEFILEVQPGTNAFEIELSKY